jgi:hypothetical protein
VKYHEKEGEGGRRREGEGLVYVVLKLIIICEVKWLEICSHGQSSSCFILFAGSTLFPVHPFGNIEDQRGSKHLPKPIKNVGTVVQYMHRIACAMGRIPTVNESQELFGAV